MSECVLAVGEVFPLDKGRKRRKTARRKFWGKLLGQGPAFASLHKGLTNRQSVSVHAAASSVWFGLALERVQVHQAHSLFST